jgi:large subunit ribosomal protein L24
MWIKTNDTVEVITGKDRGSRGKVLRVVRDADKLVVEGANRAYKHVRKSQKNPRGGQLSKEMPLPVSNVLLVCQACGSAVRVGARYLADGSKERYCKKCGAGNGLIAPAKARYAKK